jgi:hypothetical protein
MLIDEKLNMEIVPRCSGKCGEASPLRKYVHNHQRRSIPHIGHFFPGFTPFYGIWHQKP